MQANQEAEVLMFEGNAPISDQTYGRSGHEMHELTFSDKDDPLLASEILSKITQNTINGIVLTDSDGQIVWVNPAFSKMTGYDLQEIQGLRPGGFLQGPLSDPSTISHMRDCINHRRAFEVELVNYTRTGEAYWVRIQCEPFSVFSQKGELKGFLALQTNIDSEKKASIAKEAELSFNKTILSKLKDAVVTVDSNNIIQSANPAIELIFHVSPEALIGKDLSHLLQLSKEHLAAMKNSCSEISIELTGKCSDGNRIPVMISIANAEYLDNQYRVIVIYDLSAKRRSEAALINFRRTLDSTLDCVFMFYADTLKFFYVNEGAQKQLGYRAEKLLTMTPLDIKPEFNERKFRHMIAPLINGKTKSITFETLHQTSTNKLVPVEIFLQYIELENMPPRFVAIVRDITVHKQHQQEIERIAYYDSLTGLPNRQLALARIQSSIKQSINTGRYGAIILIDIDEFKIINDTLGHSKGDEVLIEVANNLQQSLPPNCQMARLGGDEFIIIVDELESSEHSTISSVSTSIESLFNAASQSLDSLDGRSSISLCVGVTLFNDDSLTPSELLIRADVAMNDAKAQGKNQFCFFNQSMYQKLLQEQRLLTELRLAIASSTQLTAYYQPKVNASGDIQGFEALARWQHPTDGLLTPFHFINLAENNNLIAQVGEQIMRQACTQMAQWVNTYQLSDCKMSVNISQKQLANPMFMQVVQSILKDSGLPAQYLQLEITETTMAEDINDTIARMQAIQQLGVSFSLDDFGTGYSSLSYLKQLPIEELKIDRSFIHNLHQDREVCAIVEAVVQLSKNLHLSVVCEGVEEEQQWHALKQIGCDLFQGYLFGKPMPASEIEKLSIFTTYKTAT